MDHPAKNFIMVFATFTQITLGKKLVIQLIKRDRHARFSLKSCMTVAFMMEKQVFWGHTSKKSGKNLQECSGIDGICGGLGTHRKKKKEKVV